MERHVQQGTTPIHCGLCSWIYSWADQSGHVRVVLVVDWQDGQVSDVTLRLHSSTSTEAIRTSHTTNSANRLFQLVLRCPTLVLGSRPSSRAERISKQASRNRRGRCPGGDFESRPRRPQEQDCVFLSSTCPVHHGRRLSESSRSKSHGTDRRRSVVARN